MKIVCAWCNAKIGGQGMRLSHGICNRCFSVMMQRQFEFMEELPYFAEHSRRVRPEGTRRGDAPPKQSQPFLGFF